MRVIDVGDWETAMVMVGAEGGGTGNCREKYNVKKILCYQLKMGSSANISTE